MRLVLVCLLLVACNPKEIGGGWGVDLTFLPFIDGNVYQCTVTMPADQGGGVVTNTTDVLELCFDDGAAELAAQLVDRGYGSEAYCVDTPRHLGPCHMVCAPDTGRGCNAFDGCWCPLE